MIQKNARLLQGKNFCKARDTVEHELAAVGRNRGGADAPHQRRPPQLRHRPKRGEFLPPVLPRSYIKTNRRLQPPSAAPGSAHPSYSLQIARGAQQSLLLVQIHSITIIPIIGQNIDSAATEHALSVHF